MKAVHLVAVACAMIASPAAAAPRHSQAVSGGWHYSARTDAVRDHVDRSACVLSDNLVRLGFPYRSQRMRLCLRRDASGTDVFVDLPAGGQYYCVGADGCSVTLRFDRQPSADFDAGLPSDGSDDTLFIYHEDNVVRAILAAKSLIIEAAFYQAGDQQLRFNVGGLRWDAPPAPAEASPPTVPNGPVEQPIVLQAPSRDDVARYYPERAARTETSGQATIDCGVTAAGTLADCRVVGEVPSDMGFGDAALKMAHVFKLKPQTRGGVATGDGRINLPIDFKLPRE